MTDFKNLIRRTLSKIFFIIPENQRSNAFSIGLWLFVGILIRMVLMPIFASGDSMTTVWISFNLMQRNQFILSNDPPTVFFLLGGLYFLMKPFFPSAFLAFYTSNTAFTPSSSLQLFAEVQPGIATTLFLSKIPYLIFDIASALLILTGITH